MRNIFNIKFKLHEYFYKIQKEIDNYNIIYQTKNINDIEKIQIKRFNQVWAKASRNFEFYKKYKYKNLLPDQITSLDDLDKFPLISKFEINSNFKSILRDSGSKKITKTGGTSGIISFFPTGFSDSRNNFIRQTYLRNKFRINSQSKCLYIWGHSHKFGDNFFSKNINSIIKKAKNYYFNRYQISAYDLNNDNIEFIIENIQKNIFEYILCYGSTLRLIINYLKSKKIIVTTKIKIITTSENIGDEIFNLIPFYLPNTELINEFGMAETGVIGYNDTNNYNLINNLWYSFLIQKKNNEIILNTLEDKIFPLIRYTPDDDIICNQKNSIIQFQLKGKSRPVFFLKNNNNTIKISSIVFDHIFKNIDTVYSSQYFYDQDNKNLTILYCSKDYVDSDKVLNIISQKINFEFNNINLKKIEKPIKTQAGKFKYILEKSDLT